MYHTILQLHSSCVATRFHDSGISDDTRNPEVPKACSIILTDQDVPLNRTDISVCPELTTRSKRGSISSLSLASSGTCA